MKCLTVLLVFVLCSTILAKSTPSPTQSAGPGRDAGPKILTTAVNGVSLATPSRNTFFLCPGANVTVNGTDYPLPTVLTKPNSSWVLQDSIIISKIPTVKGSVSMKHTFKMSMTKNERRFKGNGIPNHPIGRFPIIKGTTAYELYSQCPAQGYANAAELPVKPYDLDVTVPRNPVPNAEPTCMDPLMYGIATQTGGVWHVEYAIDGSNHAVDPNAALPTDLCWGHPYATQYHYHGYSWKCFPNQGKVGEHSPLFGYAMDGFGIYGPRSQNGVLVRNVDLDVCHGHKHEINWDGVMKNMYHYHVNSEYPYSVGCFRGTPVHQMFPLPLKDTKI